MAGLAEPYAARVIAATLGIPENEWPMIARDSATLGLAAGVRIREDLPPIEAALGRLYAYADAQRDRGLAASQRQHPPSPPPPNLRPTRQLRHESGNSRPLGAQTDGARAH